MKNEIGENSVNLIQTPSRAVFEEVIEAVHYRIGFNIPTTKKDRRLIGYANEMSRIFHETGVVDPRYFRLTVESLDYITEHGELIWKPGGLLEFSDFPLVENCFGGFKNG